MEENLRDLKRAYTKAVNRHNKMCEWLMTASHEEQMKYTSEVIEVIKTCNSLLTKIKKQDRFVTANEILHGFKEVR